MAAEILHLTLILVVTTGLVMFLRMFSQPPILSYILAGLLAGPAVFGWATDGALMSILSSLGVAFLLFIVGIELDFRALKTLGLPILLVGIGQVLLTSLLVFVASALLGFTIISSVYLSIALTFSSTIIVVKLLSDKHDTENLHGKLAIGVLLVQDVIAIFALLFISALAQGQESVLSALFGTLIKGLLVAALAWGITVYILPSLARGAGKSQEVLFLFSLTWCFVFATVFSLLGLGMEIGALLAGILLAGTPYSFEISSRIKPLRDFFIIIFFIVLGSHMDVSLIGSLLPAALALSLVVILAKPLIIMGLLGLLGFSKRTSFLTGATLSQISEFSLIVIALGVSVGHLTDDIAALATLIGLITIMVSTYWTLHASGFFTHTQRFLPFYRKGVHHHEHRKEQHTRAHEVIIMGYNRIGYHVVEQFVSNKKDFLVVDYNPQVVLDLQEKGHDAIFGDADDVELYKELHLDTVSLLVSTVPDIGTSKLVLEQARRANKNMLTILTATQPEDALLLYEQGADYVIIPHIVGGEHAANMLELLFEDMQTFLGKKHAHMQALQGRKR